MDLLETALRRRQEQAELGREQSEQVRLREARRVRYVQGGRAVQAAGAHHIHGGAQHLLTPLLSGGQDARAQPLPRCRCRCHTVSVHSIILFVKQATRLARLSGSRRNPAAP